MQTCSVHVAAGGDGDNVRVPGKLFERHRAVHVATGISMICEPDEVSQGELGASARVGAVLLHVGHNRQDVEHVALASAHAKSVTFPQHGCKRCALRADAGRCTALPLNTQ